MTLHLSRHVLCTPYNHVTSCKATYTRSVHACLAVTCHLHFWQNDQGLLRATAVTRGWNGYRNKCAVIQEEEHSLPCCCHQEQVMFHDYDTLISVTNCLLPKTHNKIHNIYYMLERKIHFLFCFLQPLRCQ